MILCEKSIDYSNNNVAVIYAPNGTMKSSLAKTFEAIRDGKPVEEKVFGNISSYDIVDENNTNIPSESIIEQTSDEEKNKTLEDLRNLAKEKKIKNYSKMTKAELEEALKESEE